MINSVALLGNLTKDAELKYTKTGFSVMEFSLAVNERVKKGEDWEDRPSYIDCIMFGTRGEKLAPKLTKGTKVCVSGSLRQERWEKDGKTQSRIKVIAKDLDFAQSKAKPKAETYEPEYYEDDLPF